MDFICTNTDSQALKDINDWWERCYTQKGIPISQLRDQSCIRELLSSREGVENTDTNWFDSWQTQMTKQYEDLLQNFGEIT